MRLLGTTDEVTTCQACGKKNLKKTIVVEAEGGDIQYLGCDCAALKLLGTKKDRSIIEHRANAIGYARRLLTKHDPKTVARAVTNAFGYATEVRSGVVRIQVGVGTAANNYTHEIVEVQ